jgi:transmembrane sensor
VNAPWQLLGEQAAMPELLVLREEALGHAREARWSRAPGNAAGRPFRAWPAVAAVALLALAGGLFVVLGRQTDVYRTGPGERRSVTLADNSEVVLDARSEVRVTYGSGTRRAEVLRGQAHFSVSHDPSRPFTVHAQGQQVRALGTEFNVDLLDSTLAVTLISGRVKVRPEAAPASTGVEMQPGQQLLMVPDELPVLRDASADLATAWEKGQLVFENEPLDAVVARFNRYNVRRLRLEGEGVADLRISGVFKEQDLDGFVATVTSLSCSSPMPITPSVQMYMKSSCVLRRFI